MGKTKVIRFAKQGGTAEYYPSLCVIHKDGFFIEVRFIHKVVWISNYMYSLKGELICQW